MDKKKKIIVAVVSVLFIVVFVGYIKFIVFSPNTSEPLKSKVNILTPNVDEKKIDRKSKLQNYEEDNSGGQNEINDVVRNLSEVAYEEEELSIEDNPVIEGIVAEKAEKELLATVGKSTNKNNYTTAQDRSITTEEEDIDAELKRILALQDQLLAESNLAAQSGNPQDIDAIIKSYNQYAASLAQDSISNIGGITPEEISKTGQNVSERLSNSLKDKIGKKNFFQGAGSANVSDKIVALVPAETVDQGILVNGSTIAIRTKKAVMLKKPDLTIPKGAIVYGKVNIATDRLLIDVNSYKKGNKLYILDFSLYDFDGREGVHLGNRTWPKIPSKVTKDVYDYAYQRGTQAAGFGGSNNSIRLEEAKDIAILSAAKEVGDEVFEKRRIFMPKKYHLWFNINTQ